MSARLTYLVKLVALVNGFAQLNVYGRAARLRLPLVASRSSITAPGSM